MCIINSGNDYDKKVALCNAETPKNSTFASVSTKLCKLDYSGLNYPVECFAANISYGDEIYTCSYNSILDINGFKVKATTTRKIHGK